MRGHALVLRRAALFPHVRVCVCLYKRESVLYLPGRAAGEILQHLTCFTESQKECGGDEDRGKRVRASGSECKGVRLEKGGGVRVDDVKEGGTGGKKGMEERKNSWES